MKKKIQNLLESLSRYVAFLLYINSSRTQYVNPDYTDNISENQFQSCNNSELDSPTIFEDNSTLLKTEKQIGNSKTLIKGFKTTNGIILGTKSSIEKINRGGELGKSGPGARAKADALNRAKQLNFQKSGSRSVFANAFTTQCGFSSKPGQNLKYKNNSKITENPVEQNNRGQNTCKASKASNNESKKDISSGLWDYNDTMEKLAKQSNKTKIKIQISDQIYKFNNPYYQNADELQFKLAEKMYDSIRECDTDICDIAENLGFKVDNIKNVKEHVFYNEHDLDRYGPDRIERKQFDPNLKQALAWKRLENGTQTQDDVTWIKHECAERHHELKYGSGYNEAHNRAQTRFDGEPWKNQF